MASMAIYLQGGPVGNRGRPSLCKLGQSICANQPTATDADTPKVAPAEGVIRRRSADAETMCGLLNAQ